MRCAFVLLFAASAAFATPSLSTIHSWNQFKLTHNKVYDLQEEKLRFKIFSDNLQKIEEHNALYNAGLRTYKKGVNKFADMTQEEFEKLLTLPALELALNGSLGVHQTNPHIEVPDSIDYREQGAVNPVRDQGQCGSCWAFGVVASVESVNFLRSGALLSLSEQNLVDCNKKSYGCNGGFPFTAFEYIRDNGLESQDAYPYTAADETCKFNPSQSAIKIRGYKWVERGSEEALKSAVGQIGPCSVSVDARELMSYESGIFIAEDPNPISNHAMTIVGYGTENGQDFWIVRNSWTADWGEKGYVRIARNYNNQINIANEAIYPEI